MKAVFRKARDEDVVDHCNKVWTVAFFLALALTTWIVPLATDFNNGTSKPTAAPKKETEIRYSASCWTPSQFTAAHVQYVNTYCGNSFNDIANGRKTETVLYEVLGGDIPPSARRPSPDEIQKRVMEIIGNLTDQKNNKEDDTDNTNTLESVDNVYKYPIALFLIAVLLRVPYLLCKLVSGCFGLLNIDLVLSSAVQAQSLDSASRRETMAGLAKGAGEETRRCSRALTGLYVLTKLLCCVLLICALVGVQEIAVTNDDSAMESVPPAVDENRNESVRHEPHGMVLLCNVPIIQIQNTQEYSLQCAFSQKPMLDISTGDSIGAESTNDKATLKFFEVLTNIVLVYLVVLFIANITSLFMWACRLCCAHCQPTSAKTGDSDMPMDYRLLLLFSNDNAGPVVTSELAQNFLGDQSTAPEKERLELEMAA